MKRFLTITFLLVLAQAYTFAQDDQTGPKREVTLYNVYKPTLGESKKRGFFPSLDDTIMTSAPDVVYDVETKPFFPEFKITPLKAATLEPDPLPKLYKSYVNLGLGNHLSPLVEVSVSNERSKKGAIGLYARHYSTNGTVKLDNNKRVFAGYMDNDVSIYGKKFFKNNILEGSLDYAQKSRFAYGYNPDSIVEKVDRKDIRLGYQNFGANLSLQSMVLDSTRFSYDFDLGYNLFYSSYEHKQNSVSLYGKMRQEIIGFNFGINGAADFYFDSFTDHRKYTVGVNPYVSKKTDSWNVKLGLTLLLDRSAIVATSDADTMRSKFHIYPDVEFGITVIPSYLDVFFKFDGEMEQNTPLHVIKENPYIYPDGSLFMVPNTDHKLRAMAGVKGNNGLDGNYLLSVSYDYIDNMLFYDNFTQSMFTGSRFADYVNHGRYFLPFYDNVELLNAHGEFDGPITERLSYKASGNYYHYTSSYDVASGKQTWDANLVIKYNLRNKIIASINTIAIGKRDFDYFPITEMDPVHHLTSPTHVNVNFSAEYRYTKILSFWVKVNNIAFNKYYDYAFYPTQRFMFMGGLTYSL